MTATADPFRGQLADWPGRPQIEAPGLQRPAAHCATIATADTVGERAVLVLASESGEQITTAQLVALAGHLEACFGDETPEGSRAALQAQVDRLRREVGSWRQRAELAEEALRNRSNLSGQAAEVERLTFEAARNKAAHDFAIQRLYAAHDEREELRRELQATHRGLEAARERADHVQYALDVARDQQARARVHAADLQHRWQYRRLRAAALAAAGGALAAVAAHRHH